jgi:hypothetical protein
LGKSQGLARLEELGKLEKKIIDLDGSRTRDIQACILNQIRYRVPQFFLYTSSSQGFEAFYAAEEK